MRFYEQLDQCRIALRITTAAGTPLRAQVRRPDFAFSVIGCISVFRMGPTPLERTFPTGLTHWYSFEGCPDYGQFVERASDDGLIR